MIDYDITGVTPTRSLPAKTEMCTTFMGGWKLCNGAMNWSSFVAITIATVRPIKGTPSATMLQYDPFLTKQASAIASPVLQKCHTKCHTTGYVLQECHTKCHTTVPVFQKCHTKCQTTV